ncbi:hypothetical protein FF38_06557 [Lucilia cuprina]|uniref:Uncharacterized protein n=1 Tax=Lucilia cuprina TaxID=7375 RepID=A0A0L0C585_LUCCU|nr:hypothetical protein FF38_06557 [Lucilia cuprina]
MFVIDYGLCDYITLYKEYTFNLNKLILLASLEINKHHFHRRVSPEMINVYTSTPFMVVYTDNHHCTVFLSQYLALNKKHVERFWLILILYISNNERQTRSFEKSEDIIKPKHRYLAKVRYEVIAKEAVSLYGQSRAFTEEMEDCFFIFPVLATATVIIEREPITQCPSGRQLSVAQLLSSTRASDMISLITSGNIPNTSITTSSA